MHPPNSSEILGTGNLPPRRCPKGKRAVKKKGKVRCVAKKHKKGKHKQRPAHHRKGSGR